MSLVVGEVEGELAPLRISSVVEQPHPRKRHHDAILIGGRDDIVVPDGAAGLGDVLHAGLSRPLHVVAEGEEGVWQQTFAVKPAPLTAEEKRAWIATLTGVTCGSDAFFPFGDNVERARKSGVQYIAEPGGSIRDDHVIETANKYGMVMCFTGMRLFHH